MLDVGNKSETCSATFRKHKRTGAKWIEGGRYTEIQCSINIC